MTRPHPERAAVIGNVEARTARNRCRATVRSIQLLFFRPASQTTRCQCTKRHRTERVACAVITYKISLCVGHLFVCVQKCQSTRQPRTSHSDRSPTGHFCGGGGVCGRIVHREFQHPAQLNNSALHHAASTVLCGMRCCF